GKDPIDQLNFMADRGFRSLEDNGMKGRSVELQEKMASTLEKRGMRMGVFVAHEISWTKPNLTNGDTALREKFLQEVKESIEVAKRDRKSTRLNSSHVKISYAVFCLKKKMIGVTRKMPNGLREAH